MSFLSVPDQTTPFRAPSGLSSPGRDDSWLTTRTPTDVSALSNDASHMADLILIETIPTSFVTGGPCEHLICLTADVNAFHDAFGDSAQEIVSEQSHTSYARLTKLVQHAFVTVL
jgi:hypothetical protein